MTGLLVEWKTKNAKETCKKGEFLGHRIPPGTILALEGDLGSGKTTFIQGVGKGLEVTDLKEVRSPTFTLIQEHLGKFPFCHVDLYRITLEEIKNLGLEEYWKTSLGNSQNQWIIAIEWAQKIKEILNKEQEKNLLIIKFETLSFQERKISILGNRKWKKIFKKS
ncbi:MAG: tRNA (adenosine(37)-N6)-threonylcarbamoyltransferase complex ATPase subunit type 1 TsaE [Elusimicrobia bacterium]|nr:tRNA (adenosine(37)-N6)-threonylcarbamoyltransferase complex ATPase subunit type 1 TsaE [Elusimicrobiota bacterium]